MSAPVSGVQPQASPTPVAAPSSAHAATAGAVASANGGEANSTTKIGSMEDLKKKAPKLYQKMLEGIAMAICNDMKEHQDRLKQLMRDGNAKA